MAFMDQKRKSELTPGIKAVMQKYGLKGTLRVSGHSALLLTITAGPLDFIDDAVTVLQTSVSRYDGYNAEQAKYLQKSGYLQVNEYHISQNHTGICRKALMELRDAMNYGNWDKSDIQTDYFNVGWYTYIHVGKFDRPYQLVGGKMAVAA